MTTQRCFICDEESLFYCKEINIIKSKYSDTLIITFLEEFLNHSNFYVPNDDWDSKIFCQDCLWKIDEYDQACVTAKQLKEEFCLLLSKERFQDAVGSDDGDVNNETEQHIEETVEQEEEEEEELIEQLDNDIDDKDTIVMEQEYVNIKIEEVEDDIVVVPVKSFVLKCKECNIVFNNIKDMKKHKKIHTISEVDEKQVELIYTTTSTRPKTTKTFGYKKELPPDLTCKECSKKFSTRSELTQHKKIHDCRCPKCDGQYPDQETLEVHIQKHDLFEPLQCVECSKQFTKRNNLARHMPIHTGEKLYQCELCGKEYIHHSSFRMHKMAHKNIREKSCTTCGLTFRSQSHLNRHIRIHTGAKPYECPVCNQKFAQRYNMLAHTKIHSNHVVPVKKPHRCVICGAAYAKPLLLREHMKRTHCDTLVDVSANSGGGLSDEKTGEDVVLSEVELTAYSNVIKVENTANI